MDNIVTGQSVTPDPQDEALKLRAQTTLPKGVQTASPLPQESSSLQTQEQPPGIPQTPERNSVEALLSPDQNITALPSSVGPQIPEHLLNNPNYQPLLQDIPAWGQQMAQQALIAGESPRQERTLLDTPPGAFRQLTPPRLDQTTGQRISSAYEQEQSRQNSITLRSRLQDLVDHRPYQLVPPSNELNSDTRVPGSNRGVLRNNPQQGSGEPSNNPISNFAQDWWNRSVTQVQIVGTALDELWNAVVGRREDLTPEQNEARDNLFNEYIRVSPTGQGSEEIDSAGDTLSTLGNLFPETRERLTEGFINAAPVPNESGEGYRNNPLRGEFGEYGRGWTGALNAGLATTQQALMAGIYGTLDTARMLTGEAGNNIPLLRNIPNDEERRGFAYRFSQAFGGVDLGFTNVRDGSGNRYLSAIPAGASEQDVIRWGAAGLALDALFGGGADDLFNAGFDFARLSTVATARAGGNIGQGIEAARRLQNIQSLRRSRNALPQFNTTGELPQPAQAVPEGTSVANTSGVAGELPPVSPSAGAVFNMEEYINPLLTPENAIANIFPREVAETLELNPMSMPPLPFFNARSNDELLNLGREMGVINPDLNILTNGDVQRLQQVYGNTFSRFGHPLPPNPQAPSPVMPVAEVPENLAPILPQVEGTTSVRVYQNFDTSMQGEPIQRIEHDQLEEIVIADRSTEIPVDEISGELGEPNEDLVFNFVVPPGFRPSVPLNEATMNFVLKELYGTSIENATDGYSVTFGDLMEAGLLTREDIQAGILARHPGLKSANIVVDPELDEYAQDFGIAGTQAMWEQQYYRLTQIPAGVEHVVTGHGDGSLLYGSWNVHLGYTSDGTPIVKNWQEYVNENYPPGENVLVLSCARERAASAGSHDEWVILQSGGRGPMAAGEGNFIADDRFRQFPFGEGTTPFEQLYSEKPNPIRVQLEDFNRMQSEQSTAIRANGTPGVDEALRLNEMSSFRPVPSTGQAVNWLDSEAPRVLKGDVQPAVELLERVEDFVGASRGLRELETHIDELRRVVIRQGQRLDNDLAPFIRGEIGDEIATKALYGQRVPGTEVKALYDPLPSTGHSDPLTSTKQWFHGTRQTNIEGINFHEGTAHEYGVGLYLTTDPDYADVASRAYRNPNNPIPGTTRLTPDGRGLVYSVSPQVTRSVRLDGPVSSPIMEKFFSAASATVGDDVARKYIQSVGQGTTVGDMWLKLKEVYGEMNKSAMPELSYREFSRQVSDGLRDLGYDGLYSSRRKMLVAVPDRAGRVPMQSTAVLQGIGNGTKIEAMYSRQAMDAMMRADFPESKVTEAFELQSRVGLENAMMEEMVKAYIPAAKDTNEILSALVASERKLQDSARALREVSLENKIRTAPEAAMSTPDFQQFKNTPLDEVCL